MFEIQFDQTNQSGPKTCSCCGEATWNVWASIWQGDHWVAVYYFAFAEGHDYGTILVLAGAWGDDTITPRSSACFDVALPSDRLAFRPQPVARHPVQCDEETLGLQVTVDQLESNRGFADQWYAFARVAYLQDDRVRTFLQTGRPDL